MGLQVTEVVKNLLIINVLMFFGTMFLPEHVRSMLALHYFEPIPSINETAFRPYQIVTHAFMHGGLNHLFFNMFAVYMFGPVLESTWGSKRFLSFYLFSALGAVLLHTAVNYLEYHYLGGSYPVPVVGASGAVFGLLLGFGVYYPNQVLQLLFPPIPIKAKYFVMIYAVLELYLGVSGRQTGVAHFAHLGGALFGLLMILYWRSRGRH